MAFPLGVGVNGEVMTADFSDPNMCHLLVAGAAGSGKSEFLKSLVASLIRGSTPGRLQLFLIDPKAVTFTPLANRRRLAGPIMTDIQSTLKCLEEAVADMDSRYIRLSGRASIASGSEVRMRRCPTGSSCSMSLPI